jgi:hypothetical protein
MAPEASAAKRDELINGLSSCQTVDDLRAWEKANNNGVKRRLLDEDAEAVDDQYELVKSTLTKKVA